MKSGNIQTASPFSPDSRGKFYIVSLDNGTVRLWDNRGFSPCGSYLACTEARTEELLYGEAICLWDIKQQEILTTLPFRYASRFAYSPYNELLASASFDGSILLWDLTPYLNKKT